MQNKFLAFFINLLITVTSIAYPVIWLFAGENYRFILSWLPWIMLLLWFGRAFTHQVQWQRYFAFAIGGFFAVIAFTRTLSVMYWYPVLVNVIMLAVFGGSLFASQTFVERLARLQIPDLSDEGIIYTRRVTQVWCVVFLFNIIVVTLLILSAQYYYWAIFTGVISYIIIAAVMSVEWIIRQNVMKKYR